MLFSGHVPSVQTPARLPEYSPVRLKRLIILGIPLTIVDMKTAVDVIAQWIDGNRSRYICELDVHSIMRAQDDPVHNHALCRADMVLPDGMPLVWMSKLRGKLDTKRVCGPDLMFRVFERSARQRWRHYFFG